MSNKETTTAKASTATPAIKASDSTAVGGTAVGTASQASDPTSTGPGMFKNPGGKTGAPPPVKAKPPIQFNRSDFTPVQGGMFHNLITGQLHKAVTTTRLVFKANGEPEWDKETGEQKTEEIPIAEQEAQNEPIGPFVFHHVLLTKGLGDPTPGTMNQYEHPQCFPDEATTTAVIQLIGNAAGAVSIDEIKGDTVDPKDYKDTVYLVIRNHGMTNSPALEMMPGSMAIEVMADNALKDPQMLRRYILDQLRLGGVLV